MKLHGLAPLGATIIAAAPLADLVHGVVEVGAKPQVRRIAARWIVTGMTDVEAIGDRAIGRFIRNAVDAVVVPAMPGESVSRIVPDTGELVAVTRRTLSHGTVNTRERKGFKIRARKSSVVPMNKSNRDALQDSPEPIRRGGHAGLGTAPAMANTVAVWPIIGNAVGCGTIIVKHWKLHSGGPVGVCGTATGNSFEWNYSALGAIWQFAATVPAIQESRA